MVLSYVNGIVFTVFTVFMVLSFLVVEDIQNLKKDHKVFKKMSMVVFQIKRIIKYIFIIRCIWQHKKLID